jgi:hypothetical protein
MLAKRDGEFEVISRFMSGDSETKSFLFDEVAGLMPSLLSQLKVALVSGTHEEKKGILKKLQWLRHTMQAHYERLKAKVNLSDEELKMVIEHFVAQSPVYQHKINSIKQELDVHKNDLSKFVQSNKKKRSNPAKTKSKWIRS